MFQNLYKKLKQQKITLKKTFNENLYKAIETMKINQHKYGYDEKYIHIYFESIIIAFGCAYRFWISIKNQGLRNSYLENIWKKCW